MHLYIDTDKKLQDLINSALGVDRYAIDTEFHRERTYYPQVALIQIAVGGQVALIDPLAIDLKPFAELLSSDAVCVLHAGVQDLEVLDLSCGTIPSNIFDTQIAAGFLGIATASLGSLLDRFMGVSLPKSDRLTDWLSRPLSDTQLAYAASDVEYLLELADLIESDLEKLGRVAWAAEEFELIKAKRRNRRRPEEAINKIKEGRSLKGEPFRVAKAVAAWRERRASTTNVPVRQVMSDLGVIAIAQRAPATVEELVGLRGVERKFLRNGADSEILASVEVGKSSDEPDLRPTRSPELPRHLRPVVTLITSWIAQIARDNKIDPALLATRADVESMLKNDPESRIAVGWREELVGRQIAQLVSGQAAVAFDGDGGLVLEARSDKPLL